MICRISSDFLVALLDRLFLFTHFKCSFEVWMFCFVLRTWSYVVMSYFWSNYILYFAWLTLAQMRTHVEDWKIKILASKLYFCSTSKQSHFAQKLIQVAPLLQLIEWALLTTKTIESHMRHTSYCVYVHMFISTSQICWKPFMMNVGFLFVSRVGASLIMQDTRCTQSQIIFSNTNLLTLNWLGPSSLMMDASLLILPSLWVWIDEAILIWEMLVLHWLWPYCKQLQCWFLPQPAFSHLSTLVPSQRNLQSVFLQVVHPRGADKACLSYMLLLPVWIDKCDPSVE